MNIFINHWQCLNVVAAKEKKILTHQNAGNMWHKLGVNYNFGKVMFLFIRIVF